MTDVRIITVKCESDSRAYDQTPHDIILEREDADAWHGRPVANPRCPTLTYPRYAWREVFGAREQFRALADFEER